MNAPIRRPLILIVLGLLSSCGQKSRQIQAASYPADAVDLVTDSKKVREALIGTWRSADDQKQSMQIALFEDGGLRFEIASTGSSIGVIASGGSWSLKADRLALNLDNGKALSFVIDSLSPQKLVVKAQEISAYAAKTFFSKQAINTSLKQQLEQKGISVAPPLAVAAEIRTRSIIKDLQVAIKGYQTEYDKYPVPSTTGDIEIKTDDSNDLIAVLMGRTPSNPRGIKFIDLSEAQQAHASRAGGACSW